MIRIDWKPGPGKLRWFSVLQVVFFAAVGALWYHRRGSVAAPAILVVASLLVAVVGWVWLPLLRRVYLGWMLATYPAAWLISHLVLAVLFYLVFTPMGLILRLFGHDPLQRRFDPSARSYWVARPTPRDSESYLRQF